MVFRSYVHSLLKAIQPRTKKPPIKKKQRLTFPERWAPWIERLETREMPAFLDLGTLTFDAPVFTPDGGDFKVTSGNVSLGMKPIGGSDVFRPLIEFRLDALNPNGELTIHTSGSAPTFQVSNATLVLVATEGLKTTFWQTTEAFTFDARSLLSSFGQDLSGSGTPLTFDAFGANFTTSALLLANDSTTDTQNSYVGLQGDLGFAILPALKLRVDGDNYVYAQRNNLTLTGAGMSLVSPNFKVGGMNVTDAGLNATYSYENGTHDFRIQGGFTLASQDGNLQSQAAETQAGSLGARLNLVISDGAVQSLGGSLNTKFQVYKAEFVGNNVTFAADLHSDTFRFAGDLTLTVKPDPNDSSKDEYINAIFGSMTNPNGLVVQNGTVQNMTAYVTGSFNLLGANFNTIQPLTLEYNHGLEQFEMSGAVSLSAGSTNKLVVTAELPSAGNESGLIIKDGHLQRLDLKVSAGFQLGGLNVAKGTQDDLEVSWTNVGGNSTYTVSGNANLQNVFHVAVDLGSSADVPGIKIVNGEVQFDDLTIKVREVPFGAFNLKDLVIAFQRDPTTGVRSLDVGLDVRFPGGWSIHGQLDFVNGGLDSIDIGFSAEGTDDGIPLGDSGLFLTYADIAITNLDDPTKPFTVAGDVAVTFGPQTEALTDPNNPSGAAQNAAIVAAQGAFIANGDELSISGGVYFGAVVSARDPLTRKPTYDGLLGEGTGFLNLDWAAKVYSAGFDYEMLDGAFNVSADFTFKGSPGDYTLFVSAQADLAVPKFVPVVGGLKLASADFILDYEDNFGQHTGFVAGWVDVAGVVVGVEYDIGTGHWSLIGKKQADALIDCEQNPEQCLSGNGPYNYHNSFAVPQGVTEAVFSVDWPENVGSQSLALVLPNNQVIQQQDFPANNITLLTGLNTPTKRKLSIVGNPNDPFQPLPAGNYELQLISTALFEHHPEFTAGFKHPKPTAAVASAFNDQTNGNLVHVTIQGNVDPAFKENLTMRLFIDTNAAGYKGTALPLQNGTLTFADGPQGANSSNYTLQGVIDLSGLFFNDYYVYASVSDGVNTPVYSTYSANVVTSQAIINGQITNHTPGHVNEPISGITVFIDVANDGVYNPGTDPAGVTNTNGGYTIVDSGGVLVPNQTYSLRLVLPQGTTIAPTSPNPSPANYTYQPGQTLGYSYELDLSAGVNGFVFEDLNKNGQYDPGVESTVPGRRVYIDLNHNGQFDPNEPNSISLSQGDYHIYGLTPSVPYTLRIELPVTYYQTAPLSFANITLADGTDQITGLNFGVLHKQLVQGTVKGYPLDQSGVLSTNTTLLANWPVHLMQNGTVVQTTNTDANGHYQFLVEDGEYTVAQVVQSGWRELSPFAPQLNMITSAIPTGIGFGPSDAAAADLDGDGNADLVVISSHVDSGNAVIFWGDGAGHFPQQTVLGPGMGMNVLIDTSGGKANPDIYLWNDPNDKGEVYRYSNNGNRNFGSLSKIVSVYDQATYQWSWEPTVNTIDVALGDLNGDKREDVVIVWIAGGQYGYSIWYAGDSTGGGTIANVDNVTFPIEQSGQDAVGFPHQGIVKIVDLQNDGHKDILFAGYISGHHKTWITAGLNNGSGTSFQWSSQEYAKASNFALADIDRDGLPDLLYADATVRDQNVLRYLRNNGDGVFSPIPSTPQGVTVQLPYSQNINFITALTDLNGDLRPEIVVFGQNQNAGNNWFSIWTNAGSGPYYSSNPQTTFGYGVGFSGGISVSAYGDFNRDGLADLAVSDWQNQSLYVYLNQSQFNNGVIDVNVPAGGPPQPTAANFVNGQVGQLCGIVHEDVHRNGVRDAADIPLHGVRVYVDLNRNGVFDDGIDRVTTTGPDGAYAFTGLPNGVYRVRVLTADPFLAYPEKESFEFTVAAGQSATHDFPLLRRWLKPVASVEAAPGANVAVLVEQTGAASNPSLRFLLDSDAPPGAMLDPVTGALSWTVPFAGGHYAFTVHYYDPFQPLQRESATFVVNVPNQAPVNTVPGTQTIPATSSLLFSAANGNAIRVQDADAGSGNITANLHVDRGTLAIAVAYASFTGYGTNHLTITGSIENVNKTLNTLFYQPAGEGTATLTLTTSDLGNTGVGEDRTDTDTVTLNIVSPQTHVNTPPSIQAPAGNQSVVANTSFAFSSNAGNALTVGDVDAGYGVVQLSLSAAQGRIKLGWIVGLTFQDGTSNDSGRIVVRGRIDHINYNLQSLTYTPLASFAGSDTLHITVNDLGNTGAGGAKSANATIQLKGTTLPLNLPPVNHVPVAQSVIAGKSLLFSPLNGNALAVSDPDAGDRDLRVELATHNGTLAIAIAYDVQFTGYGTNRLTLTGSAANLNKSLATLFYQAAASSGADTLTLTTSDLGHLGAGSAQSDQDSVAIVVRGDAEHVNRTPVIHAPNELQTVAPGGTLAFSAALGNALALGDPDAGYGDVEVTLAVNHGVLNLTPLGAGGPTVTGNGGPSLRLVGRLDHINYILQSLRYVPTAGFTGADLLALAIDDRGRTGAGGAKTASRSVPLRVGS